MLQQKAFDEASTRRVEADLDGMARYAAAQTKAWEWNTHTAVMADIVNEAEANYNNPQRLQNVRDRMDAETADYGSKHGWSGDVFRYQLGQNNDKLWSAVIKRQAPIPAAYSPPPRQAVLPRGKRVHDGGKTPVSTTTSMPIPPLAFQMPVTRINFGDMASFRRLWM